MSQHLLTKVVKYLSNNQIPRGFIPAASMDAPFHWTILQDIALLFLLQRHGFDNIEQAIVDNDFPVIKKTILPPPEWVKDRRNLLLFEFNFIIPKEFDAYNCSVCEFNQYLMTNPAPEILTKKQMNHILRVLAYYGLPSIIGCNEEFWKEIKAKTKMEVSLNAIQKFVSSILVKCVANYPKLTFHKMFQKHINENSVDYINSPFIRAIPKEVFVFLAKQILFFKDIRDFFLCPKNQGDFRTIFKVHFPPWNDGPSWWNDMCDEFLIKYTLINGLLNSKKLHFLYLKLILGKSKDEIKEYNLGSISVKEKDEYPVPYTSLHIPETDFLNNLALRSQRIVDCIEFLKKSNNINNTNNANNTDNTNVVNNNKNDVGSKYALNHSNVLNNTNNTDNKHNSHNSNPKSINKNEHNKVNQVSPLPNSTKNEIVPQDNSVYENKEFSLAYSDITPSEMMYLVNKFKNSKRNFPKKNYSSFSEFDDETIDDLNKNADQFIRLLSNSESFSDIRGYFDPFFQMIANKSLNNDNFYPISWKTGRIPLGIDEGRVNPNEINNMSLIVSRPEHNNGSTVFALKPNPQQFNSAQTFQKSTMPPQRTLIGKNQDHLPQNKYSTFQTINSAAPTYFYSAQQNLPSQFCPLPRLPASAQHHTVVNQYYSLRPQNPGEAIPPALKKTRPASQQQIQSSSQQQIQSSLPQKIQSSLPQQNQSSLPQRPPVDRSMQKSPLPSAQQSEATFPIKINDGFPVTYVIPGSAYIKKVGNVNITLKVGEPSLKTISIEWDSEDGPTLVSGQNIKNVFQHFKTICDKALSSKIQEANPFRFFEIPITISKYSLLDKLL